MNQLFSRLTLADVHCELLRNIISTRESQDLFDDLTDHPEEWELAQQVEHEVKPHTYQSSTPVIHRPFEDAEWFTAIAWPFNNWQSSRFSDGSFGVWYGINSVLTTVYESAYHWYRWLLCDAGFEHESVVGERKIYTVRCDAALIDFRSLGEDCADLLNKTDYGYAQGVGARMHREGHPGCVVPSARHSVGENYVVFNPAVLSNAKFHCQLTYRAQGGKITVEKNPNEVWLEIKISDLQTFKNKGWQN